MNNDENEKNKNLHISPIANTTEDILAHSPEPVAGRKSGFPLIRIVIGLIVAIASVVGVGAFTIFSAVDKESEQLAEWRAQNPYKTCQTFEGKTYTLPVEKKIVAPESYYDDFEITVHNVTYNIPGDERTGYSCVKGTGIEMTISAAEDENGYAYGVSTTNLRLEQEGTVFDYFLSDSRLQNYINKNNLRVMSRRIDPGITTRGWMFFTSPDDAKSNANMVFKFEPYSKTYAFDEIALPAND